MIDLLSGDLLLIDADAPTDPHTGEKAYPVVPGAAHSGSRGRFEGRGEGAAPWLPKRGRTAPLASSGCCSPAWKPKTAGRSNLGQRDKPSEAPEPDENPINPIWIEPECVKFL